MSEKSGLDNCMRQCERLIAHIETACDIPQDKLQGDTAKILITIRQEELIKIKKVYRKIHALLEEQ